MMTLTLPNWMVDRIVYILENHPYTGANEIVSEIKDQVEVKIYAKT